MHRSLYRLVLVRERGKRLLEAAVYNDTAFLASFGVMDYSLLCGVDRRGGVLTIGIIDYVRQYTWDKQLETYVKASGVLGGAGREPTVISPNQYKKRFRRAMSRYFVMVERALSSVFLPAHLPPLFVFFFFSVGKQMRLK